MKAQRHITIAISLILLLTVTPPLPHGAVHASATTGTISGRVTVSGSGVALANFPVMLGDWRIKEVVTSNDGTYVFTNLPFGSYKVIFGYSDFNAPTPRCVEWQGIGVCPELFNHQTYSTWADLIVLSEASPSFVANAVLDQPVTLSGIVVGDDTQLPVPGVEITLTFAKLSTRTGADGKFRIPLIRPSFEILEARPGSSPIDAPYLGQFFDHKSDRPYATTIDLNKDVTDLKVSLVRTSVVRGRVIAAVSGLPASTVNVSATPKSGQAKCEPCALQTDGQGRFDFRALPGQYDIAFTDNAIAPQGIMPKTLTVEVTSTTGLDLPDIALDPGGAIITSLGGRRGIWPLSANIELYDANNGHRLPPETCITGTCLSLPNGVYKIHVSISCETKACIGIGFIGYWDEFYKAAPSFDLATPITITAPMTTSINITMTPLNQLPPWIKLSARAYLPMTNR